MRDGVCQEECDTLECFWDDSDCLVPIACEDCKFKKFEPVGVTNDDNALFNDTVLLSVCCVASITKIDVFVHSGAILGISTLYEVNGILEPPIIRAGNLDVSATAGSTSSDLFEQLAQNSAIDTYTFEFTYEDYLAHVEGNFDP